MGGGDKPKFRGSEPVPSAQPIEAQILAGDITKKKARKKGRSAQILAGALNRQVLDFGKQRVGE